MAANIRFYPKSATSSKDALPLNQVDAEICAHFDAEVHPQRYYFGWFDHIAYYLAAGKTWDQVRAIHDKDYRADYKGAGIDDSIVDHRLAIIDFMESRYNVNTWVTVGK